MGVNPLRVGVTKDTMLNFYIDGNSNVTGERIFTGAYNFFKNYDIV